MKIKNKKDKRRYSMKFQHMRLDVFNMDEIIFYLFYHYLYIFMYFFIKLKNIMVVLLYYMN